MMPAHVQQVAPDVSASWIESSIVSPCLWTSPQTNAPALWKAPCPSADRPALFSLLSLLVYTNFEAEATQNALLWPHMEVSLRGADRSRGPLETREMRAGITRVRRIGEERSLRFAGVINAPSWARTKDRRIKSATGPVFCRHGE